MNIELTVGRQATAAETVANSAVILHGYLRDLDDSLQVSVTGFRGSAAAGFGAAMGAWFAAALKVVPALDQYAQALATVDREHGHNEHRQESSYARLSQRLGGGQP